MLHLQRIGDVRNLVRLVDTWAEVAQPTTAARLAQAEALLGLCQTDRAWIRLRELTDAGEGGVPALILTARMFIQRGWPKHARRPLELAMSEEPDAEGVQLLWRMAHAPPAIPDVDVGIDDDDVEGLVRQAEAFLSTGSVINGRRILEKLRKRAPNHKRISDLLWALEGDFRLPHASLAEAVSALEPGLGALADVTEDVEHTESLGPASALLGAGPAPDNADASFPALFRAEQPLDPLLPETTATELTHAAALASSEELRAGADGWTDPSELTGGGDTEIMLVIHRDGGQRKERATSHIHVEASVDRAGAGFDLAAYRKEMGMTYSGSDIDADLEDEDDELIILTGPERERTAPPKPPDPTAEVDLPDPETTSGEEASAPPTPAPRKGPAQEDSPRPAPPPMQAPRGRARPSTPSTPWWLLSFGVILWMAAAFLITAVLLKLTTMGG